MTNKVYRHRNGTFYLLLISLALHTETNETLAIYMNREGAIFARPSAQFFDGRFALTGEDPDTFMLEEKCAS